MTRRDLRASFMSPIGQQILLWILHEHHVFSNKLKTPEEITLHNWGMKLISLIGPRDTKRSIAEFLQIAMMEDDEKNVEVTE